MINFTYRCHFDQFRGWTCFVTLLVNDIENHYSTAKILLTFLFTVDCSLIAHLQRNKFLQIRQSINFWESALVSNSLKRSARFMFGLLLSFLSYVAIDLCCCSFEYHVSKYFLYWMHAYLCQHYESSGVLYLHAYWIPVFREGNTHLTVAASYLSKLEYYRIKKNS